MTSKQITNEDQTAAITKTRMKSIALDSLPLLPWLDIRKMFVRLNKLSSFLVDTSGFALVCKEHTKSLFIEVRLSQVGRMVG